MLKNISSKVGRFIVPKLGKRKEKILAKNNKNSGIILTGKNWTSWKYGLDTRNSAQQSEMETDRQLMFGDMANFWSQSKPKILFKKKLNN